MDRRGWDQRYSGEELLWRAEPNRFLVEEVSGLAPGRSLDVACGEGRNAVWLAEQGWSSTGVDFSAVGLEKARKLAARRGVEVTWVEADLLEWAPPASSYDLIIVMYLQVPPAQRRAILGGLLPALAPGGTLLVVGHDLANLTEGHGGPQDPALLYTPGDLVSDLSGLRVVRMDSVRRPVTTPEGAVEAVDALVRAERPAGS